jgi:hypothetical protein
VDVEFTLTEDDVIALNRYHIGRKFRALRWLVWPALVLFFLPPALLLLLVAAGWRPDLRVEDQVVAVAFYSVVLALLLLRHRLLAWSIRRFLRKGQNARRLLVRQQLTIGPEGLSTRSEHHAGVIAWPAVAEVVATRDHAFFYTSTASAFVLPRHAFAGEEAFKDFVETARRYKEEAGQL